MRVRKLCNVDVEFVMSGMHRTSLVRVHPCSAECVAGVQALILTPAQVCCSLDSSLVVGVDGTLFTFGDNSLAQLGRMPGGDAPERSAEDWVVKTADDAALLVTAVAAGLSHCLATTGDGQVCGCFTQRNCHCRTGSR